MRAKAPRPADPALSPGPVAAPLAPLSPLQAAAEASPRALQFRALQAAADVNPRGAPLRSLRALANARSVAQRVRFSATEIFTGEHLAPSALPADLGKALAATYAGATADAKAQVATTAADRVWLAASGGVAGDPASVHADIRAKDWESLGARTVPGIETVEMTESYFNEQAALMTALGDHYNKLPGLDPGAPIRVASFQFSRAGADGPLTTTLVRKPIDEVIAGAIREGNLIDAEGTADLRAKVQANVNQTLFSAAQFQWIAANWAALSATHDVFVDVDYYANRMPSRVGMHKDSVGETLFVNLTYNNAAAAAGAEYAHDNATPADAALPEAAKGLVAATRATHAGDAGKILGGDMPRHARTSFIDPAMWHSTPLYGRRLPKLAYADDAKVTLDKVRTDLKALPDSAQRKKALAAIDTLEAEHEFSVDEAKALLKGLPSIKVAITDPWTYDELYTVAGQLKDPENVTLYERLSKTMSALTFTGRAIHDAVEPFAYGATVTPQGGVRTPLEAAGRLTRARSTELAAHADRAPPLAAQAEKPRAFIRTWISLRKRPPAAAG